MERTTLPKMDVSSWWLQAVVITFLFGFAILGYLAIRIYQESPPVPGRIVSDWDRRSSLGTTYEPARNHFSRTASCSTAPSTAMARTPGQTSRPTTCTGWRSRCSVPMGAPLTLRSGFAESCATTAMIQRPIP